MNRRVVMIRPEVGGVAHVARSCAGELRRRGASVTELVGADGGSPALDGARQVWSHRAHIRSADVVHVELGITAVSTFWIALWASLLRGGLVTVVHDDPRLILAPGSGIIRTSPGLRDAIAHKVLARLFDRLLRSLLIRRTKVWVTLSARAGEAMEAAGFVPVIAVPHGADPPTADTPPSRCTTVVFAGFISPAKGLDLLVDAWEAVGAATNLRLVVMGSYGRVDTSYAEGLRARLESFDPSANWAGWISEDDAFNSTIAEAAIVVLPYRRSNPLSGILIRAAVEGRAIIGSVVPAVVDFLTDGITCSIVEASSVDELAHALQHLAADAPARDELGEAAAHWAADNCTWAAQVDHLEAAYER